MIAFPQAWRLSLVLAAFGLFFALRPMSRLLDRWFDSRAEPTAVELDIAARLYRLHPQPPKLTAGEGCPPTAPSLAVHQPEDTR